ncbi:MAG: Clp1/GlmU family protein [Armatimonadota bacterium]
MPFQLSDEWKYGMFRLLEAGGRVLVVGPPDVGKSTFCLALANACVVQGKRCVLLDADMGQSEVGPPGTLGLTHLDQAVASFADLQADELFFVGSTSPVGHLLQCVTGIARLSASAAHLDPHLTLIDMPGFAVGHMAATLIDDAIRVADVDYVVLLRREGQMGSVHAVLRGLRRPEQIVLPPASSVLRRSQDVRSTRRRLKFASYLAEAKEYPFDGRACGLPQGGVFMGANLPMNERLAIERVLGRDVVYAETVEGRTLIVTRTPTGLKEQEKLPDALGRTDYMCVPETWFANVLVGLGGEDGRHHAAGVLKRVDFRSEHYHIVTPLKRPGVVKQILLGSMRIALDGRELGRVAPGELFRPVTGRSGHH